MIALASDHGGFDLKVSVANYLKEQGFSCRDFGCYDKSSCDYPVFAKKAAAAVASGECEFGVLFCTTGIGISIAANKVKGIRCALCTDPYSAKMARLHNDANMLAMGGAIVGSGLARQIADVFLRTPFSGEEKHRRRIGMLEE